MRWSFASYGQHSGLATMVEGSVRIDMLKCREVA
jgi:hypothetical protein